MADTSSQQTPVVTTTEGYGYGYGSGYGYNHGAYQQYGGGYYGAAGYYGGGGYAYYGGQGGYGNYGGGYGGYGYGPGHPPSGEGPHKILTIRDYLLMIRERVWYLVLAIIVCTACSLVYTSNSAEVFQAASKLRVFRRPYVMPVVGLGQETDPVASNEDFNTQIEMMKSNEITERVLKRLSVELRHKVLAPYQKGSVLSGPLRPLDVLEMCRAIYPFRASLLVYVAYTHPDPVVATQMAQFYAEEIRDYNLDARTKIMNPLIEQTRVYMESVKNELKTLQDKRIKLLAENPDLYKLDSVMNFGNNEIVTLNAEVFRLQNANEVATMHWKEMHEMMANGGDLTKLATIGNNGRVMGLIGQLTSRRISLAGLLQRYNEEHPAVITTRTEIAATQKELDLAIQEEVNKIDKGYELAQKDLREARKRLDEKKLEMARLNQQQLDMRELARQIGEKEGAVARMDLTYHAEQLKAAGGMMPNIEILDKAVLTTTRPINKDYVKSAMTGLLGGAVLGLLIVFGLAFLDDRVKSAADIEGFLGLPLVGILPIARRGSTLDKARLVETGGDRAVKEAFRTIYSALRLNEHSRSAKAILVTSTSPSEGKSFVATNLALTYAAHGERVLLIDCDLRMPVVAKTLNLAGDQGITKYFLGEIPLEDAIHYGVAANFDVLPVGSPCENPTQILGSRKFAEMISTLKGCYDRVIVDSPPIGAVSDALNMLSFVDGALYVVRFNTVKKRFIRSNIFRLRESKVPIYGAILNQIGMQVVRYYTNSGEKSYNRYYSRPHKDAVTVPVE